MFYLAPADGEGRTVYSFDIEEGEGERYEPYNTPENWREFKEDKGEIVELGTSTMKEVFRVIAQEMNDAL